MKQFATDWWAKIITATPHCTYYFGPFSTREEAELAYPGYVEDLNDERATGIVIVIERAQPEVLTICESEGIGSKEPKVEGQQMQRSPEARRRGKGEFISDPSFLSHSYDRAVFTRNK
ncbi:MAG: DUF1816 domain-containing protein [Xenococcaceae cyanobacterium]